MEDLVGKVLAFIADYNRTATPLRWTYDVRSLRHALGSIVGVVSELGEVLELLHDAAGRVTTLSATLGEWWDEQQSRRAMEAAVRNAQGASHTWLVGDGEPSPPRYREHRTSIHYQRPGRYRSERQPVAASQEPAILQVCDGTREWTYVPERAEAWVQQAGASQMADDLLDPAWLPGEFLLGVAERLHREGRAAIQLHGRLRAGQDRGFGGSRAPPGAEEIRAIIDADTGLLLELTSLFEGEPLSRRSLHDVVLNEPLDEALFRFTPPPGTRVEDVHARQHRPPLNLRWRLRFWRSRPRPVATYGRFRRRP